MIDGVNKIIAEDKELQAKHGIQTPKIWIISLAISIQKVS
jgi:hypothetical protein